MGWTRTNQLRLHRDKMAVRLLGPRSVWFGSCAKLRLDRVPFPPEGLAVLLDQVPAMARNAGDDLLALGPEANPRASWLAALNSGSGCSSSTDDEGGPIDPIGQQPLFRGNATGSPSISPAQFKRPYPLWGQDS